MRPRQLIATKLPSYELSGEVGADAGYFGCVYKGKIPDAKTEALLPMIREKVEPNSLDRLPKVLTETGSD